MTRSPDSPADALHTGLSLIDRLDPEIRAFVHLDQSLVERPAAGGPLRNLSVGVKDLFRVGGMPTRAGSRLPPKEFEGAESLVVTRLRAAGATVVGKTAMDEFAYCEPPATKNPLDRRRTPGGSSGGSAATRNYSNVPPPSKTCSPQLTGRACNRDQGSVKRRKSPLERVARIGCWTVQPTILRSVSSPRRQSRV